jgi:hypothetical protein
MFPPSVPSFRIRGLATREAASASHGKRSRIGGLNSTSVSVVIAPISIPPSRSRTPVSSAIPTRSMTASGLFTRSRTTHKPLKGATAARTGEGTLG